MHQPPAVYQPRSLWMIRAIADSPEYRALRTTLPVRRI